MSDDPLTLICPKIRASDFMFTKKAEDDDLDLYCSRCHQLIDGVGMVSMSLCEKGDFYGEWRFHQASFAEGVFPPQTWRLNV